MLTLQRSVGNRAVRDLLKSGTLQAKLKVGQAGDIYEQEAERLADMVTRMPVLNFQQQTEEEEETFIQSKPLAAQITPLVQRQAEEEEELLQPKGATASHIPEVAPDLEARIQSIKGSGQPLPESVRAYFEPRFGHEFTRVRTHSNREAAEIAQSLNAKAFTVGRDIMFGAGEYAPKSVAGKKLLAHELTHIVQQSSNNPIGSKSIQRAVKRKPAPVVIVSGAKKVPKPKLEAACFKSVQGVWRRFFGKNLSKARAEEICSTEDAAEKFTRTTGAKLEKAGLYRFVPVSGYRNFMAKAHKRLKANECASKVLIDGHGGSDANSAWMTIGSVTDPNRGWGTTDIGNNNGKLIGTDVFKNVRFCTPCEVYLGGCNFSKNSPGLKFMQAIANATRCITKAYATKTTTNPKTGFPVPASGAGERKKKPGKP